MMRRSRCGLFVGVWALALSAHGAEFSFDRDIRPILSDKCFHCHGPDENTRGADLRLDTFDGATEDLGGYAAIVPGDLEASELIYRITTDDPDDIMPTEKSHLTLSDREKDLLKLWVKSGAEYENHWSFEPVVKPVVPEGENPIDHFIKKQLKEAGLQQNSKASSQALSRRMALDLTGLPLTGELSQTFDQQFAESSDQAVADLLDQLFASPHYGERMAWDWLDVSRYADTNGYQGDRERTMWPWRDWVAEAFQKNLPWDQFTLWQLAGDLLESPTQEQILATGFNRNHPINGEGGRIAEENRVEYVFDMTETMGTTWLGLTLECSRCHDHKFDPISQVDYFALNAFFNQTPVSGGGGDPQMAPRVDLPTAEQIQRRKALLARRSELEKENKLVQETQTLEAALVAIEAKGKNQSLTIEDSGTVVWASGDNPKNDSYEVIYRFPPEAKELSAIRLEALQHESHTPLPEGLARSNSGNFVLTEIEVSLSGKPVELVSGKATYEQRGFAVGDAIDGKNETGWAVHRGKPVNNPESAVFFVDEKRILKPEDQLQVTLRFDSKHEFHNMGRFRVSLAKDNPEDRIKSALDKISKQLDSLNKQTVKVMVMQDMEKPRDTFILEGGLYNQRGEKVNAAIPAVFGNLPQQGKINRLSLAQWLVDGQNPLTARVTVNRLWQMFFGTGLVKTSEDFGVQGERPSHPELLDWLAAEFVDSGWDVQHIIRLIVSSNTYQQSSQVTPDHLAKDSDNRLLARSPRHRLPSWMIRDQALAASGLLVRNVGGAPVNTYQPPGIWEEVTFGKKKYVRDDGDKLYRRSIYTFWRRISAPTILFDSADRLVCDVLPSRTNTPLQALTTLNDITYIEAARVAAQNQDSVAQIFQRITNRLPSDAEVSLLERRLLTLTEHYQKHTEEAERLLAEGEFPVPKDADISRLAARTAVVNLIYNLDEVLCRP